MTEKKSMQALILFIIALVVLSGIVFYNQSQINDSVTALSHKTDKLNERLDRFSQNAEELGNKNRESFQNFWDKATEQIASLSNYIDHTAQARPQDKPIPARARPTLYNNSTGPVRLQNTWDPFEEIAKMQNEIDSLFDTAFDRLSLMDTSFNEDLLYSRMELSEEKDAFKVTLKIPDMEKKSIKASVDNNVLTVSGSYAIISEKKDANNNSFRKEERKENFSQSILLPSPVDSSSITSEYKDHVLTVTVKKVK